MDRFKFRAWNKKTNTIVDLKAITPLALDPTFNMQGMDSILIPFHEDLIIMQCTGLPDIHGVLIYESDILNSEYHFKPSVIQYVDYACGFFGTNEPSSRHPSIWGEYEIIGNIHENPELLEDA